MPSRNDPIDQFRIGFSAQARAKELGDDVLQASTMTALKPRGMPPSGGLNWHDRVVDQCNNNSRRPTLPNYEIG